MVIIRIQKRENVATYGSVSQYCCQHSEVPLLLIPPDTHVSHPSDVPGVLSVVAVGDVHGMQRTLGYTLNHVWHPDDTLHVMFVTEDTSGSDIQAKRDIRLFLKEAYGLTSPNASVEVIKAPAALDSSGDCDVEEYILERAEELRSRMLVMLHHRKQSIQEMVFGSLSSFVLQHCNCPLLIQY
jgi:hypothetical protein